MILIYVAAWKCCCRGNKKRCKNPAVRRHIKFLFDKYVTLGQYVLLSYISVMEIQLPWQLKKCVITFLCKSILSSLLAHMLFGTMRIFISSSC